MNIKHEGADNGGHALMIHQEETPIIAFAALLPPTPTEAEKKEPVPSEIQTSVTLFNDHGDPLCASEKVKHLVEVACPDRWLLPLIERAGGTNGIVKLSYGCGYETIVFVGNAKARDAPTGRLAVGVTVNRANATIEEIGDVCVSGSEILWNCMPRSADPPSCLYLRTSNQRFMIPPLPANELQKRSRMLRVWPATDDPKVLERMEDVIEDPKSSTASRSTGESGTGGTEDEPKKKKKAKKDPNMPKQGKNAYNFFLEENVDRGRAENPDAKYPEIREKLTEEYKSLSKEEKAKYIAMAEEDKEKQDKAIADYLAEHPPKVDDDDDSDDEEKPKKKAHRQKKDPNAPKNAMNAFLYWSKEQRPVLKAANPDATFQDFNKILSSAYKALSKEELAPYQALADADRERYDNEMKAYKESKDNDDGNEKPAAVIAEPEHEEEESATVESSSVSKKRKSSEATDDATEEHETEAAPASKSRSHKKKKKKKKKHRKSE